MRTVVGVIDTPSTISIALSSHLLSAAALGEEHVPRKPSTEHVTDLIVADPVDLGSPIAL